MTSRDVPSRVSSFEARLVDAGSAPAGSSPVAALDSAALQPSPMLHTPRQLTESPVASTPNRQQHGFMASPMASSQVCLPCQSIHHLSRHTSGNNSVFENR